MKDGSGFANVYFIDLPWSITFSETNARISKDFLRLAIDSGSDYEGQRLEQFEYTCLIRSAILPCSPRPRFEAHPRPCADGHDCVTLANPWCCWWYRTKRCGRSWMRVRQGRFAFSMNMDPPPAIGLHSALRRPSAEPPQDYPRCDRGAPPRRPGRTMMWWRGNTACKSMRRNGASASIERVCVRVRRLKTGVWRTIIGSTIATPTSLLRPTAAVAAAPWNTSFLPPCHPRRRRRAGGPSCVSSPLTWGLTRRFSFGLDNLDYCRSTSMTSEANRGRTRLVEITLVCTRLQARYTSYTSASGEWRATREWDGRTAYNRGEAKRREGEGKGTYMSLGRRKSGHKGVGERRKTHQYIAVRGSHGEASTYIGKYGKDLENCIKLGDCCKKDLSRTTPLVGTFSRLHGVEPNMRQGEAGAIGAKAKMRRGGEGWREGGTAGWGRWW
ncbi:hypothetical protein B0H19DRAFT_1075856 [Mycena capillaripes]|nr:hypothetical protein B0H19DRAFT_1075856 [Mycena capillaripes]